MRKITTTTITLDKNELEQVLRRFFQLEGETVLSFGVRENGDLRAVEITMQVEEGDNHDNTESASPVRQAS